MKNVKVHYAGAEQFPVWLIAKRMAKTNYSLLTAYPFICQSIGLKRAIFFNKLLACDLNEIPNLISSECVHTILDSGLFTLMFGSERGKKTPNDVYRWFDALCRFINDNITKRNISCVEVDCQKVLSPNVAWDLRREMRKNLPHHDILNVWHLEDGLNGLDKMVEFSNYICLSIPEYRNCIQSSAIPEFVSRLVKRILAIKPDIRIHLLGCTEERILKPVSGLVYSSDSTSWSGLGRWHPKTREAKIIINYECAVETKKIIDHLGKPYINSNLNTTSHGFYNNAIRTTLSMKVNLDKYTKLYGPQD